MSIFIRYVATVSLMAGLSEGPQAQGLADLDSQNLSSEIARPNGLLAIALASDYVVDKTDSVCGLDSAKQLTNPAVVDYDKLLDATPEIREMKAEQISETSAKGIQLRTAAEARVRKACDAIMTDKSHCSVWKKIKRKDGKKIPDITKAVKKKITDS